MTENISRMRELLLKNSEWRQQVMRPISLQPGQFLFHQGDAGDAFYLIEQGQIRICILDQDNREITLNTLSVGETLGELALVDARPRSASAIAVDECHLLRLDREDFLTQLDSSPELAGYMSKLLSSRVRHMTEYIEQMGRWTRMIIDGQYNTVIASIEQLDPMGDQAVAAVAESLRQMVRVVKEREESLRQQVDQLRIEIDEEKRRRQVDEVTGSDSFQKMLEKAKKLRRDRSAAENP